ncbi:MAG: recombinase family protein [Oscillospiraceae bacterium]|nr:recombinase family protein [Oscillospiraceae bacterium]
MVKERMQNTGIYVRLSKEDLRQGESLSIENQKAILLKHVVEQGWNLVEIYVDDGYSGGNFNRPGFQRMMGDVERGLVNVILTKDMSRFGRDYIEVGRYTEHVLPRLDCRLVALHDGMDTESEQSLDFIPFKNLFNDFYLRDCSRKQKSAQRVMAERGKFSGSRAPYGYKLAHDERNSLVIDEYAATIVRRIFTLRINGIGPRAIARILNAEGVESPSVHCGVFAGPRASSGLPPAWNDGGLRKILSNEAYIGNMVQHKTESRSHKTKERKKITPDSYIRVEGMHEAIIDAETWRLCQAVINADRRVRSTKDDKPHLFAGLLLCADCGYAMRAAPKQNKDGSRYVRYVCGRYASGGKSACASHSIREDTLCEIVRQDIRRLVPCDSFSDGDIKQALRKRFEQTSSRHDVAAERQTQSLQKRLGELTTILRSLYEDKALGRISHDDYLLMVKQYQAEHHEKTAQLKQLQAEQNQAQPCMEHMATLVKKILAAQTLPRNVLCALISKMEIGDGSIKANTQRDITITYKASL